MHGTKEASNDGRVRLPIIHGLNISHKELTYLLQKSISHRNKVLRTCSQGGGWQELTIARPRPSRKDKQSKYNARQFGYIVSRPYACMLRESQTLTPTSLLNITIYQYLPHIIISISQNYCKESNLSYSVIHKFYVGFYD